MNNNRELLGAIADLSRSVEDYNSSAAIDYRIGLAVPPNELSDALSAYDYITELSLSAAATDEEVIHSPCHAVTHGMYSVNSAKIYIQF